jgi:hypothetical protein
MAAAMGVLAEIRMTLMTLPSSRRLDAATWSRSCRYSRAPHRSCRPVPLHSGHLPKRAGVLPPVRADPPHLRHLRYGHLRSDERHCQ